ncbi:MAG: hypothetical protein GF383_13670 [Candidatus Lokiarchaeota archaeon]|nr:hypothetical protein [Candidatus Lokiarchaeota archaeon]MBD3342303.1 hypothetical protein [Candidatus Lokiarchaeota archaeon]
MEQMSFPYKCVLVACSVNTARSPMAEGFLRFFFEQNNLEVEVRSCGVASNARDGMLISMDAKLAMQEEGIELPENSVSLDIKKHPELLNDVDLILTLTNQHKREIKCLNKTNSKQIMTLAEFADEEGDIEDPSMKGLEGFRIARDKIKECIIKGLKKFGLCCEN